FPWFMLWNGPRDRPGQ
ncbi:unnamed protein product, partial [Rotaria magnacalcarata]